MTQFTAFLESLLTVLYAFRIVVRSLTGVITLPVLHRDTVVGLTTLRIVFSKWQTVLGFLITDTSSYNKYLHIVLFFHQFLIRFQFSSLIFRILTCIYTYECTVKLIYLYLVNNSFCEIKFRREHRWPKNEEKFYRILWNFEQREEKLRRRTYHTSYKIEFSMISRDIWKTYISMRTKRRIIERITVIEPDRRIDGTKIEI